MHRSIPAHLERGVLGAAILLMRFIDNVSAGNVTGEPAGGAQKDLAGIRSALEEWGPVQSIQIANGVGNQTCGAYEIKREYRSQHPRGRVEVRWDTCQVRHEHEISVWLVAFDRDGKIWSVRVGLAPAGMGAER